MVVQDRISSYSRKERRNYYDRKFFYMYCRLVEKTVQNSVQNCSTHPGAPLIVLAHNPKNADYMIRQTELADKIHLIISG